MMVLLRVVASENCALLFYFVADCNISYSDAALLPPNYLPAFTVLFFPLRLSRSHMLYMTCLFICLFSVFSWWSISSRRVGIFDSCSLLAPGRVLGGMNDVSWCLPFLSMFLILFCQVFSHEKTISKRSPDNMILWTFLTCAEHQFSLRQASSMKWNFRGSL